MASKREHRKYAGFIARYITDDLIKEVTFKVGENVKVNRFTRFALGE